MKKTLKVLIVIDIIVAICFFITYGPWNYCRDFLITTAMTTKDHKYLARIFYGDKTIQKVLSNNYVGKFDEDTDESKVKIGNESQNYASIYEKEILERDKNALYKLIEFKYNGYDVFLTAIYDPSRVELVQTKDLWSDGEYLVSMAKRTGAKAAINAGGFIDVGGEGTGGSPTGAVIKDGKIVNKAGGFGQLAGFNNNNILVLTNDTPENAIEKGMRDAVQFGPFLIVNGKEATISGNGGWGINPRTALAQREDGIVLFLVVDGNGANKYNWSGRGGASMEDLITILKRYGAFNAVNMDGGASTTFVLEGKLYNNPCGYGETGERKLPNGWIVK